MAGIFHLVVAASLVFAFDFSSRSYPVVPLPIQASLILEEEIETRPPPVEEPVEPVVTAEDLRALEEETKRRADLTAEQDRIRIQQLEDKQRRDRDEAERKKREEAEVERRRDLAEQKRQEDIERQRLENERQRREADEAEIRRLRQLEIDAEDRRLERMQADDASRWRYALQGRIRRNYIQPASAPPDLECTVNIRQLPGGRVVDVTIGQCNGDASVRRAVEAAIYKASPLPSPDNPAIFERDLRITFKPEQ